MIRFNYRDEYNAEAEDGTGKLVGFISCDADGQWTATVLADDESEAKWLMCEALSTEDEDEDIHLWKREILDEKLDEEEISDG